MIVDKLEEMVLAAKGRPVILVNPNLIDRPSSNNMMQIRGRAVYNMYGTCVSYMVALIVECVAYCVYRRGGVS